MELTGGYTFPQAEAVAYMDTAAEGLPFPGCEEAVALYFRDKSLGTPGRDRLYEAERETRQLAARLMGATMEDIALVSSASEGLNLLANSLSWTPGDEIVLSDLEFPSNVLPWLRLRERGVRVRVIRSDNGVVLPEQFTGAITTKTRLVTVSQVSYKTGAQFPFLPELAEYAHRVGAYLAVDATQALGRVPVSVAGADYLVCSSYKWLLAPHGMGLVYLSPSLRSRLTPGAVGWYSVAKIFTPDRFERFEYKSGAAALVSGMPNFPGIYALRASLRYLLEADPARLDVALKPLIRELRDGLCRLGVELLTPAEPQYQSGIISFAHPAAEEIGAALGRLGVVVWSGDGRVRASVHLYNRDTDIDRYLGRLDSVLKSNHL